MTEQEFEVMTHKRTVFACLSVATLALNQLKQLSSKEAKYRLGVVEKHLDGYVNKIKTAVLQRDGLKGANSMHEEFDKATDFMNVLVAIGSIVPNNPTLQQNILDRFEKVVEEELLILNSK